MSWVDLKSFISRLSLEQKLKLCDWLNVEVGNYGAY